MLIRLFDDFENSEEIISTVNKTLAKEKYAEFVVGKEFLFANYERVNKYLQRLSQKCELSLFIDENVNDEDANDKAYVFTKEETNKLIELNNILAKTGGVGVYFCDEQLNSFLSYHNRKSILNLNQVLDANKKLDAVVEKIKSFKFSPYEAMLYIHEYVANIVGTGNGYLDRNASATIMGAYTGAGLVCAGRSSLIKTIIDKLNMPGLSCENVHCSIHNDSDLGQIEKLEKEITEPEMKRDLNRYKKYGYTERHRLCLISLNDKKYDICGDYLNDASWDGNQHSFAMCCYPVNDVLNFANCHFVQTDNDLDSSNGVANNDKEASRLAKNLKKGTYVPDVVQKHGQNSKPISRSSFELALKRVYKRTEEHATEEFDKRIENSNTIARKMFTATASNCFINPNEQNVSV